jgi:dynein heavy chain, axonemal
VQKLKKDHIVEIKSLGAPPKAVKVIMGGVVILNQESIRRNGGDIVMKNIDTQGAIKKEEDYFETAKKYLLNDSKELLDLLRTYEKNNIPPYII